MCDDETPRVPEGVLRGIEDIAEGRTVSDEDFIEALESDDEYCYIVDVESDSILRYSKKWPRYYTGYDDVEIRIASWPADRGNNQ